METLFLTDLDGTLLDERGTLSPVSEEILRRLMRAGLPLTVATGRTPLSVWAVLRGLPLSLPAVLMNGALIAHPEDGRVLAAEPISPASLAVLTQAEEAVGLGGLLFGLEENRVRLTLDSPAEGRWADFFQRIGAEAWTGPSGRARDWLGKPVLYGIYIDGRPERLREMASRLSADSGLALDAYRDRYDPDTWCLEVFSGAASKGRAAERLRALTGAERMAAFGDGHNDLSLFQVCEERYAVENAAPEVKAAADAVIRSNRADGVAHYLERRWTGA